MLYTRRRTWPHIRDREDFTIHCRGTAIGRIYRTELPQGGLYVWTIFMTGHVPQVEGIPISGATETIEQAGSALKQSYEAMQAAAPLPKPRT